MFRGNFLKNLEEVLEELMDFYNSSNLEVNRVFEDIINSLTKMNFKFSFKIAICSLLSSAFKEDITPGRIMELLNSDDRRLNEKWEARFKVVLTPSVVIRNPVMMIRRRLDLSSLKIRLRS